MFCFVNLLVYQSDKLSRRSLLIRTSRPAAVEVKTSAVLTKVILLVSSTSREAALETLAARNRTNILALTTVASLEAALDTETAAVLT